jgi:hypothetical protein
LHSSDIGEKIGRTGGWTKLHDEELHNLYSSPSIIRVTKSKRSRWVGHVARIGGGGGGGEEEGMEDLGGKARRKETTRKTKPYVDGQY